MSQDLQEYISSLQVSSVLLSNDQLVIGKIEERNEKTLEMRSVFSIESCFDGQRLEQVLIPLVPFNLEQVTVIAMPHIVMETPAEYRLKKLYCDVLIKSKIQSIVGSDLNNLSNLETTDEIGFNPDLNDRWNL